MQESSGHEKKAPAKIYPLPPQITLPKVQQLASYGLTSEQIAEYFDISSAWLRVLQNCHPDLLAALKNGKKFADDHVKDSLYRRALGYETLEVVTKFYHGSWVETEIAKRYPPDVLACIFWLKNRQPDEWRDSYAVESRFVFEVVNRVSDAVGRVVPDKCPHCGNLTGVRESIAQEMEKLSQELEQKGKK